MNAGSPARALAETTFAERLRRELACVPIEAWGDFFPVWVALWGFLAESRPGTLADRVRASYRLEAAEWPHFRGRGAQWFMQVVLGDEMLLDGAERMMRDIVDALKDVLPGRDSLRPEEVPLPSDEPCERIAMGGLRLLDRDLANGSFKP